MKDIRAACSAGYERLAARAGLLNHINVFPVADADTGVNLRLSLAPLREVHRDPALCRAALQRSATGNSGNIAAAFFPPLIQPQTEQALAARLARGSLLARQAVLSPRSGTMLDVFEALAHYHNTGLPLPTGADLLDKLADSVGATAHILPELRRAGVVDAGALGLFFFFEGFFAEYLQDQSLLRPARELFAGLLDPALPLEDGEEDQGMCINLSLERAGELPEAILNKLGESVVVQRDHENLRLHLHSHAAETVRETVESLGRITAWQAEPIEAPRPQLRKQEGLLHLLCDAAGSLPLSLARQEGITLLESYVVCDGESRPETLWEPARIYAALRRGDRVSTAQSSAFERGERFAGILELYGPSLYLSVGSAYTGNHAAALAWKKEHDTKDRLTVVDSGAASGRLACIALLAARANRRFTAIGPLLAHIEGLCRCCEEYVCIDTLRYLAAGGRISKMRGLAGGLLGLKPIISPQPEGVRTVAMTRSQNAQRDFVLERMAQLARKGPAPLALLQYSDNEDWVRQQVLPQLRTVLAAGEILVVPLSLTSGVHMGPGTWALAACPQIGEP